MFQDRWMYSVLKSKEWIEPDKESCMCQVNMIYMLQEQHAALKKDYPVPVPRGCK
jgi:hypothetical protein